MQTDSGKKLTEKIRRKPQDLEQEAFVTDFACEIGFNHKITDPDQSQNHFHFHYRNGPMRETASFFLKHLTAYIVIFCFFGCATATPVRHLSSDVCLILPESTTKAEVLNFLGEPDHKSTAEGSVETWVYYKKNEDLIRKLPLVGEKIGTLSYETVTVSFSGDLVRACIYRQLEPGEVINSPNAIDQ